MKQVDVIIVGAGLLGCFSARSLAQWDLKVTVLEAREDVCTGISKANTGIVYSGSDTKPGTLKTELCVRGCREFSELCRQLDVPFHPCGSLMVSFGPKGEERLREKYRQGLENGVSGLKLLTKEEVLGMEPSLSPEVTMGLFATGAGTVDPWALGIAAFENAAANGAEFCFEETVTAIERKGNCFTVETTKGRCSAGAVINCAGMCADKVREFVQPPSVRLFPTAADYLILDGKREEFPAHILFQETEEGKGVTLVPTVDGNLLVGPTEREPEEEGVSVEGLLELERLSRQMVPDLPPERVIRSFDALRPNPYVLGDDGMRQGKSIHDFSLMEEDGMFSFVGIKTPGLTCAAGLGEWMAEKVRRHLGCEKKNAAFNPLRRGIPRVGKMDEKTRSQLIEAQPEYGRIVCRCRGITEGEIRAAVAGGAVTADGVKRRVGAGMGRCQGSRCIQSVLETIAKETGRPLTEITKDGGGSKIVFEEYSGEI